MKDEFDRLVSNPAISTRGPSLQVRASIFLF